MTILSGNNIHGIILACIEYPYLFLELVLVISLLIGIIGAIKGGIATDCKGNCGEEPVFGFSIVDLNAKIHIHYSILLLLRNRLHSRVYAKSLHPV